MAGDKSRLQAAIKIEGPPPRKNMAKTVTTFGSFFRRLRHLLANILVRKRDIENGVGDY